MNATRGVRHAAGGSAAVRWTPACLAALAAACGADQWRELDMRLNATTTRCWWITQVYARGVAGVRPGFAGGER
jgi:hypothetical protein